MNPKQPTVTIVPATDADLTAIAKLAGVIWRSHYPGIISVKQIEYMLGKMYSLETLREDIRARGICYVRLLVGNDFAGFAAYGPADQPKLFKLHKIYLHPDWQSKGFGSLLLQHCEREASKLGADRLLLTVNKRNAKAITAYERNGFAITDSIVTDIGGGFVMDDYVMTKKLKRE